MTIEIYGKADCNPCNLTKKFLDDRGIPYEYHDIEQDEAALMKAATYGFRSLPIVITDKGNWAGMNKDRLLSLTV